MLLEKTDLTNAAQRCAEHDIGTEECPEETTTFLVKFKPIVCVGYFVDLDRRCGGPGQGRRLQGCLHR